MSGYLIGISNVPLAELDNIATWLIEKINKSGYTVWNDQAWKMSKGTSEPSGRSGRKRECSLYIGEKDGMLYTLALVYSEDPVPEVEDQIDKVYHWNELKEMYEYNQIPF